MKQKTITKSYAVIIIICSVFFVVGCEDKFDIEEGYGYVTLNVNTANAANAATAGRTILPDLSMDDYEAFTLTFESPSNASVTRNWTRNDMEDSGPIRLKGGVWTFTMEAYKDKEKTTLAAKGLRTGIKVVKGKSTAVSIFLNANIESGIGNFRWKINLDDAENIKFASMTITPLNTETGSPEGIYYFMAEGISVLTTLDNTEKEPLTLNTGYYTVNFCISGGNREILREENLHIYKGRDSVFIWDVDERYLVHDIIVTNGNDSGLGSLRDAIIKANDGCSIAISDSVRTIQLESGLVIGENLTIKGYGVRLIRRSSWVAVNSGTSLLLVNGGAKIKISGINFNGGKAINGGAIHVEAGADLTLEACVFSGNSALNGSGGAISNAGALVVRACTFYGNNASDEGGAVINSGTLTLAGNIFYGNTTYSNRYPVVRNVNLGTVNSGGFNFSDKASGTGDAQSGWTANANDKQSDDLPFSPTTFRLRSGSSVTDAGNFFNVRPEGYPSYDFYGEPINETGAVSGAVQSRISGSGYLIDIAYNNRWGNVIINGNYDDDMLYTGNVSISATAIMGAEFVEWKLNGVTQSAASHSFAINQHTKIEAVFRQGQGIILVDIFDDSAGSYDRQGTLRYAFENAQSGDTIRFVGVQPGMDIITLNSPLPVIPNTLASLIIEGNGITIAGNPSWTTGATDNHILWIYNNDAVVKISRVHFKGGKTNLRGAAIRNDGNLTLESCIFSGNEVHLGGGAVWNEEGDLTVIGCTFTGNKAAFGGAIGTYEGSLTLAGNLFYGNIVSSEPGDGFPAVYNSNKYSVVTSLGYNVIDVDFGTDELNSCGWNAVSGDNTLTALGIAGAPVNSAFTPVEQLRSLIPAGGLPAFPAVDFNGAARDRPCAPGAVK